MDLNIWKYFTICDKRWIAFNLIICVTFSACVDGQGTFQSMGPRMFSPAFRAPSPPRLDSTSHAISLDVSRGMTPRNALFHQPTTRAQFDPRQRGRDTEQRMRESSIDNTGNPWENRPTNTFANRQLSNPILSQHSVRGNINSGQAVQNSAQINLPENQRSAFVSDPRAQNFRSNGTPQDNVLHRVQSVQNSNVGVNSGFSNDNTRINFNNRESLNVNNLNGQRPLIIRRTQSSGPGHSNSSTQNTRNFIVIRNQDSTMNAQTAQVPSVSNSFRPIPMVSSAQTNSNELQSNSDKRPFLPFAPSVLQQRASSTQVNTVLQPDAIHVVPQQRGHLSRVASNTKQPIFVTAPRGSLAPSQQIGIHRPDAIAAQPLSPAQASGVLTAATGDASSQRMNLTEAFHAPPMISSSIRVVSSSGNRSIIFANPGLQNQASLQPIQSVNSAQSFTGNQAISATGPHQDPVDSIHHAALMPSPTQSAIQRMLVPMGKIVESNRNVQHTAPSQSPTPMAPLTRAIFQALGLPTDTVGLGDQSAVPIAQAQALQRHIQSIHNMQSYGMSNFPHNQQTSQNLHHANFGHTGLGGGMLYNNHISSFNQIGNPFLTNMFLGGESPDSPDIPDPIPTPAPPTTPAPANRVSDKTQTPADPGPAKIVDAIVTELKKPVDPATIADKVSNKNNKANAGGGKVEEEEELEDLPPTTTEATTTTTTTTPETLPTTTTISTTTSTLPTATSTVAPSDTTLSQVVESLAERIMALLNPKTKKPEDAIAAPVAKPELAPRIAHPAGEIVITDGGRVATKVDDAIGVSLNVAPESVGTSVNTAVSPFDTLVKVAVNSVSSPINIIDSPVYTAIEPIGVSIHTASGPIPLPMNAAAIPVPQVKPAINSVPPPSVADSFMITLHQPQSQGADSSSKTATSGPVSPKSGLQTIDQPKQEFSAQTAPKPARRTVIIVRRNPNGSTSGVQRIIVQGESMGQSSTSALTSSHIDAPNHVTRAPPESALHNTNVNVEVKKAVDRVSSFGSLGIKHDADTERRNKDTHMDTPVGNININSAVHINPTNNHVPMDSFNANPAANVKPIRDSNTPTTLDDFGKHRLVSNRPFSPEALKPLLNTIVFPASQDTAHAQHVASNIQNIAAGNEGILRREGIQRTPILQTVPPADSSTTFHVSANETIETLSPKVSGKDTSNTVLPQSIPKPNADNKKSNKASPVKTDKSEQISARSDQSLEGTASLNQILDNTPTRISPEMLIKEIQFGAKGIAGSVNVNDQALQISQMLVNFLKQGGSTLNEQPLPNSLNEAGDVNAASDFKQNNIQNISPLSLTVNDSLNMKRPSLVDSIPATVDSSSQTVNQHARISLVPAALAPEGHSPAIAEAPVEFAPFMSSNDFGGLTLQRHQTAQSFGTPQQQFNQMDATQVLSALQTDTNTSSQPATIEYVLTSLQNFLSSNLNVQNVSFVSSTPRTTTTTTIAVTPKPSSTSTTTTIPPPPSNNAMNILASLVQLHVPHNMPPDAISVLENIKKLLTDAGFSATTTTTPISASSSTTTTISSTTATTTTTTTVPSTTTATSAAPCTPLSANFRCVGKEMFAAMESMGAWCIGMCVKDACVHTVCECGCNVTQTVSVKITTTQKMPTTTTDEPPEEEEIELEDGMTTSAKPSTTTTVDPVPSELRNLLPTSPSPSEDFTLNPLDKHSAHVRQLNKHVETVTNVAWGSQSKKDVKKAITQLAEGTVFTPKVGASTVESTTRAAPAPNWSGMHWGFPPQPIPTVPEPTPVERSWHRRPLREKWSRSERFSSLINQPTLVQPQLQLPPNMPAMMWIPVPSMANMNPFGQQMSGMRFTWGNQKAGGEGGEGGSGGEGNEANDKK